MKKLVAVVVAALCLGVGVPAEAYIIQNSSFESPDLGAPGGSNNVITNWTVGTGQDWMEGVLDQGTAGCPAAPTGDQWMYLQVNGWASQTIGTVVNNQDIDITFWLGTRYTTNFGRGSVIVQILGGTIVLASQTVLGPPITDPPSKAYHEITLNTGTGYAGQNLVLKLVHSTAGGTPGNFGAYAVLLDDITAVPEPATIAFMGMGLAAVITLRKKR